MALNLNMSASLPLLALAANAKRVFLLNGIYLNIGNATSSHDDICRSHIMGQGVPCLEIWRLVKFVFLHIRVAFDMKVIVAHVPCVLFNQPLP